LDPEASLSGRHPRDKIFARFFAGLTSRKRGVMNDLHASRPLRILVEVWVIRLGWTPNWYANYRFVLTMVVGASR
jgi:hypothetical protein